ncbi:hypothetical protein FACS189428_3700 [Clostridia bacterium]|nr:hypothetical protein FACS189428_3700 [Clostridia bacterium]
MTGQRPVVKPMQLPHLFDNPNGFPQNSEQTADTSDALRDALQGNPTQERQSQPEQQNNPLADQIQEALSQTIEEKILEDNKTPEDRSLEQFIAKERNLNPQTDKDQLEEIKQEIQQQKQLEQRVKKLTDNQGRNVYDTIVNEIFSKIVQIHKLPQIYEKSPRPFSEGGQFSASALAGGIMHRKSGDGDPLIMQQEAKKEKELKKA